MNEVGATLSIPEVVCSNFRKNAEFLHCIQELGLCMTHCPSWRIRWSYLSETEHSTLLLPSVLCVKICLQIWSNPIHYTQFFVEICALELHNSNLKFSSLIWLPISWCHPLLYTCCTSWKCHFCFFFHFDKFMFLCVGMAQYGDYNKYLMVFVNLHWLLF